MGARTLFIFCILASLATVVAAFAQEGHPLKGKISACTIARSPEPGATTT